MRAVFFAIALLLPALASVPSATACDDAQWSDERTIAGQRIAYGGRDSCDCAVAGVGSPFRETAEPVSALCFSSRDAIDAAHEHGVPR